MIPNMTVEQLDWTELGKTLRDSADDAHNGNAPEIGVAWLFLLENPECFTDSEEWPEDMPAEPPIELIAAYYHVGE